jgi:biotin carboxyl carrier protein
MYKVEIRNEKYDISLKGDSVHINGKSVILDVVELTSNNYHLILNHQSYTLELVTIEKEKREVTVKINNRLVKVVVKTSLDELLKKMGLNNKVAVVKDIGAPMPGLILDIVVSEGDEVKKGDKLLILEAMKMENIIKSPNDGKIKKITITKGDSVDSGQKLIHFE